MGKRFRKWKKEVKDVHMIMSNDYVGVRVVNKDLKAQIHKVERFRKDKKRFDDYCLSKHINGRQQNE